MKTNYREETFRTKFMKASRQLGVTPDEVISLKFRDIVSSYGDYQEMLQILEHETGIQSSPIEDDLQGRGYLVGQDDQKIIVVEHETGLEILCIAGSIASLIGLIPLVLQCWGAIRGYRNRRHANDIRRVEIRRIDTAGNLHEDYLRDLPGSSSLPIGMPYSELLSVARGVESDLLSLKQQVQSHCDRLAAIEQVFHAPKGIKVRAKKRTDRQNSNKVPKKDAAKSRRTL